MKNQDIDEIKALAARMYDDEAQKIIALLDELATLRAEAAELREWKREQMELLCRMGMQEIAREIGAELGSKISPQILPAIRALKTRIRELESAQPAQTSSTDPSRLEIATRLLAPLMQDIAADHYGMDIYEFALEAADALIAANGGAK